MRGHVDKLVPGGFIVWTRKDFHKSESDSAEIGTGKRDVTAIPDGGPTILEVETRNAHFVTLVTINR